MSHRPRGALPRLHVVTDDDILRRPDFVRTAAALLRAGAGSLALHLRGPAASGARLYELARTLVPAAADAGALLLVNDRVDVALATAAHGAHLGGRSLGVAPTRRILGDQAHIGASAHGPEEVDAAVREGADFVFLGTVYETPSHPHRVAGGAEAVRMAVGVADDVPVVAIGGVTVDRVTEVMAAGAHGVAVIRGVWDAGDPVDAAMEYLEVLARTGSGATNIETRGPTIER